MEGKEQRKVFGAEKKTTPKEERKTKGREINGERRSNKDGDIFIERIYE